MDQSVACGGGGPLLVSSLTRFTRVAVAPGVRAVDGRIYDVVYVGTSLGQVMKIVNVGSQSQSEVVVVELIQVLPSGTPVTNLHIYNPSGGTLVVVSRDRIISLPLQRCHLHLTCSQCLRLRDPLCAWDGVRCVAVPQHLRKDDIFHNRDLIQDLQSGSGHLICQDGYESDVQSLHQLSSSHPLPSTTFPGPYTGAELAGAIFGSILLGLLLGVLIGYWARHAPSFQALIGRRLHCSKTYESPDSPPPCYKESRRNSSDPYLNAPDTFPANNVPAKPINLVANILKTPNSKLPNSLAETKPASLSRRHYV